jgi:putative ABC transport system ATP-binding protein
MIDRKKKLIEIKNLNVIKNNKSILAGINFSIKSGEKILIRGESGSGKSTLIKSILFFERFSGQVIFHDRPVDEHNLLDFRRHIGYIGQIIPHLDMKIRDFLNVPLDYRVNHRKSYDSAKIKQLLSKLNFDGTVLDKNFKDLSGGEKQRILIAQVLLLGKPVYLFDEVTASLDEKILPAPSVP